MIKKFNKKQKAYLDKLVQESPTRMILSQKLTESEVIKQQMYLLGREWGWVSSTFPLWSEIYKYLNDKFDKVHGAKMNSSEYY